MTRVELGLRAAPLHRRGSRLALPARAPRRGGRRRVRAPRRASRPHGREAGLRGAARSPSVPSAAPLARRAARRRGEPRRSRRADHLDIDPRRLGEPELDGVAAFEHRRCDRRTDPGEHGGKCLLARGRAILGPQRRDELVTPDRPVAVQQQIGEAEPTLAAAQRVLAPAAAEFDDELTTELNPSTPDAPSAHILRTCERLRGDPGRNQPCRVVSQIT